MQVPAYARNRHDRLLGTKRRSENRGDEPSRGSPKRIDEEELSVKMCRFKYPGNCTFPKMSIVSDLNCKYVLSHVPQKTTCPSLSPSCPHTLCLNLSQITQGRKLIKFYFPLTVSSILAFYFGHLVHPNSVFQYSGHMNWDICENGICKRIFAFPIRDVVKC